MKHRYKTVELIVEEAAWEPQPMPETAMAVRVAADERTLQQQVKQAGGQWDPQHEAWNSSYGRVVARGLQERVIGRWEGSNREWRPGA